METLTTLLAVAIPAVLMAGAVATHLRWRDGRCRARTALVGWIASTVAVSALTAALLGVAPPVDLVFGLSIAVTGTAWALLSAADRAAVQARRLPSQRARP